MRAYWIDLFRGHFPSLLEEALREAQDRGKGLTSAQQRAAQAQREFNAYLDRMSNPQHHQGRLTILDICLERERVLRRAKFDDPYRLAKARENQASLPLLPSVLAELDALPDDRREVEVIRGVFAGNIFDLGATQTAALFQNGQRVSFQTSRQELRPRPWLVDDLDAWLDRMNQPPHRLALLFVDNAGPDIILGMIPLARHLLQRGTGVILTANTTPSLNDVTHQELTGLIDRVAQFDPVISEARADKRLRLIASGNGAPLIDLSRLSPELVQAVEQDLPDLVVLEGMGRAIESNFDARFTCDALKIAMVKDPGVGQKLGGEVYDLVFRFEPAS